MPVDGRAVPEPRERIRVVIVEPQGVVREGLKLVLGSRGDIEVVGAVATGEEAFALASSEVPDVVVMELALPDAKGVDRIRQLTALMSPPQVLVLGNFRLKEEFSAALEAGARGGVSKQDGSSALVEGIHVVHDGDLYVSPTVRDLILRSYASAAGGGEESKPGRSLTVREHEILRLISHGKTDRQTAELLKLSVKTVHTHRSNIMSKLGVHNATALVRRAIQLGIIDV